MPPVPSHRGVAPRPPFGQAPGRSRHRVTGRRALGALGLLLPALAGAQPVATRAPAGVDDPSPVQEAACRIWGRVTTVEGDRLEGFLRWDRNGTHWADLLSGSRAPDPERMSLVSRVRDPEAPPRRRVVEVGGYRVSWDEPDPALEVRTSVAVRFGHLVSLQVFEGASALLTFGDGAVEEWRSDNSDLGPGMRDLVVTGPGGAATSVAWEALDRVDFGLAPAGVAPVSRRLYGTVEDRWGRSYTGFVAWDRDEALSADTLQGRRGDREYALRFADIGGLEREAGGTRVALRHGEELRLTGGNDVGQGNRGIQVADPELGTVTVPWANFRRVRFHDPEAPPACHRASVSRGGGPLHGTVRTRDGRALTGDILWDGDEARGWEQLDGEDRGTAFQVEMARIASVRRVSFREARVELRDGRVLTLGGSNDVSEDNRGILVRAGPPEARSADDEARPGAGDGEWILVDWNELEEVRFHGRD